MAKEWEVPGLSADDTFRQAVAKIIRTKSDEMWSYAAGTILGEDIEELHSMRVSSRRLRAAVDVGAPCYPRKTYQRHRRVISGLTDALAGVRDADVMLDFLRTERERVTPAEQPGIDDLIATVEAQRAALRPEMIRTLTELQAAGFRREFDRFIGGPPAAAEK